MVIIAVKYKTDLETKYIKVTRDLLRIYISRKINIQHEQ